jgi:hypothetical protein
VKGGNIMSFILAAVEAVKESSEAALKESAGNATVESSLLNELQGSQKFSRPLSPTSSIHKYDKASSPFERAGISTKDVGSMNNLQHRFEMSNSNTFIKEQLTKHIQAIRSERYPTKVNRDILKRLLENKDRLNPKNWDGASKESRQGMLQEIYKVITEEVGMPLTEIKRTPLTFDKIRDKGMYFQKGITLGGNETIKFESDGIILNSELLGKGHYYDAVNTLYHETMHKLQSYVLETNSPYPYPEMRKEWYEAEIKSLTTNGSEGMLEYFLSPHETFSFQQADYFEKIYRNTMRSNEISFGSRSAADIRSDISNAEHWEREARNYREQAADWERQAESDAKYAEGYVKDNPSRANSFLQSAKTKHERAQSYLSKARDYDQRAASYRRSAAR